MASSSSSDSLTLKLSGNKHLAAGKLEEAINTYTEALRVQQRESAVLYANRANATLRLQANRQQNALVALSDLRASVKLWPRYAKAWYLLSVALRRRSRTEYLAERNALLVASALLPSDYLSKFEHAERRLLTLHFDDDRASVRYVGSRRGKGLFASRSFEHGDVVVVERPFASQRFVVDDGDGVACHHCMRMQICADSMPPWCRHEFDSFWQPLLDTGECSFALCACGVARFCADACRQEAMQAYHGALCDGWPALERLAVEHRSTNAPLIARLFAAATCSAGFDVLDSLDLGPMASLFVAAPSLDDESAPPTELESAFVRRIGAALGERGASIVSVANYRRLNIMINRTSQRAHPVSDVHMMLARTDEAQRAPLIRRLSNGAVTTLDELMQLDYMQALGASGPCELAFGNAMNHSCVPNIAATSGHVDHRIQFVALRAIGNDDELTRSYIDRTLPFDRRQQLLSELYNFECRCERCELERR
jgi:SET domain